MSNNLTDFDPDAMAELSPEVAADLKQILDRMGENENTAARYIGTFIARQAVVLAEAGIANDAGHMELSLPCGEMAGTTRFLIVLVLDALAAALQNQVEATGMTLEQAADILGIRLADYTEEEKGGEQDAD